jgi:hypothetical protein
MPGSKIQVVGIVQQETKPELLEVGWINSLHRSQRPDRHERRRVDHTMGCGESPQSRIRFTSRLLH